MSFQGIYWTVLAVVVMVIGPLALLWSAIDHFRQRGSDRKGTGGISAGVAGAMQELDRLMARPSVEHKIEAEQPILKREDDGGGD